MTQRQYPLVSHLVTLAQAQQRGPLAELRRGLGKVPGTAPSMYPHVARLVPVYEAQAGRDGPYYTVAALFAAHPKHTDVPTSIGGALRRIPGKAPGEQAPTHELRFRALLKASPERLPSHLRQAVGMLRSQEIAINYHMLLQHLLHWSHPERWVQRRWALDFWASSEVLADEAQESLTAQVTE